MKLTIIDTYGRRYSYKGFTLQELARIAVRNHTHRYELEGFSEADLDHAISQEYDHG